MDSLALAIALGGLLISGCKNTQTGSVDQSTSAQWPDRLHLPIQPYQKPTKIGPILSESVKPEWPKEVEAPADAPNVLLVMTDDVGFGASSTLAAQFQRQLMTCWRRTGSSTTASIQRLYALLHVPQ